MKAPELRHPNCTDTDCRICFEDHFYLDEYLEMKTGNDQVDHLSKLYTWMSRHGYAPETEWGWATPEAFTSRVIDAYAEDFDEST